MKAQHIQYANVHQRRATQIRSLRQNRADEQSAVRRAVDSKPVFSGVVVVDQPLGGGDEVVENVLLIRFAARLVPLATVLATAA